MDPLLLSLLFLSASPEPVFVRTPGDGIADPGRAVLYIEADESLRALRLTDGKELWKAAAMQPIGIWHAELIAIARCVQPADAGQGPALCVEHVEAKTGRTLATHTAALLPAWTPLYTGWGYSFGWKAILKDGRVLLEWSAAIAATGGRRHTQEEMAAWPCARGASTVELSSQSVIEQNTERCNAAVSTPPRTRLEAAAPEVRLLGDRQLSVEQSADAKSGRVETALRVRDAKSGNLAWRRVLFSRLIPSAPPP